MTKAKFIEIIKKELGLEDPAYAEMAAEAVMKTLHDRLPEDQAEHIEAQLPKELKPLWSRSLTDRLLATWRGPQKMTKKEFLDNVQKRTHLHDEAKTQHLTQGVFKALKKQLPAEEVEKVGTKMPKDLKDFWKTS